MFKRVFHYNKPSILGETPLFLETPMWVFLYHSPCKSVMARGLGLSHLWIQKCGRCENLLELFGDLKHLQFEEKENVGEDG